MKISVLVATFGDLRWKELGRIRAIPSVQGATVCQIIQVHQEDGNVCSARNEAASRADYDYLLVLDADDELAPGFCGAMGRALERAAGTDGNRRRCLFTPAIQTSRNGRTWGKPFFYPERPLRDANWLPIGTLIHRDLFWEVGGFNENTPQGFEDWELWSRCEKAGAAVVKVPDAVYRVHQGRGTARSHSSLFRADQKAYMREYHRVRAGVYPELYEDGVAVA